MQLSKRQAKFNVRIIMILYMISLGFERYVVTAESCDEIIGVYKCMSVYSSQFLLIVSCQQLIIGNRLKLSRKERTLGHNDHPLSFSFFNLLIFLETE